MPAGEAKPNFSAKSAAPDLHIVRIFDAPRPLVFEVWSKPEHLARWWGPKGFTLPRCNMDFRPGGVFSYVMRGPDGKEYSFDGEFLEIIVPERIVTRGTIEADPGQEIRTTVTFAEHEGKTKLTVHQSYAFESGATRGAPIGWAQMLDRLADYIARQ